VKKSTFLFVFVFLGGVICANILGVVAGKELGAMNEYFMNRYMYADIQGQELFPFLFYERAPKFLVLLLLSIGIFGTFIVDGYIGYLGFSVGFLSVIAIMNYGIKGVLLLLGFFFPQWLFYVPALILWYYEVRYYKGAGRTAAYGEQKNKKHIKLAVSLMLAGILLFSGLFLESYVNPFFLQNIIRIVG
jgi:stage II sporulation protein M